MSLCSLSCSPCKGGIPPLSKDDAQKKMSEIPDWELNETGTVIYRRFSFKNFVQAMAFATVIGEIAEKEGHHPDIALGWGYCRIEFSTHKIRGLHENDFIMAAKTNEAY